MPIKFERTIYYGTRQAASDYVRTEEFQALYEATSLKYDEELDAWALTYKRKGDVK